MPLLAREEILASLLDRRQERAERRREHIAELNRRETETELRLKRLYDAIESGVADLGDPALKERIAGLKAIRDQTQSDAECAQAMLESSGQQKITPQMVRTFARAARERMRLQKGGIGVIISGCSPSASKLQTRRFVSWDRKANCCGRWPPFRA